MSNRRGRTANKSAHQVPRSSQSSVSVPGAILVGNGAGRIQAIGGHVSVLTFGTTEMEQSYEAWSGETCLGLLRQVQAESLGLGRINRVQNGLFEDGDIFWMLDDKSGDARVGRNVAEEWTLAGHGTGFIHVTEPGAAASVVYSDQLAGERLPAIEGEDYLFGGCFGLHRATGEIMIEFFDAKDMRIAGSATPLQAAKLGGQRFEDYVEATALGRAPAGTAALRLRMMLRQEAHAGVDGFLLMTNLFLVRGTKESAPLICPGLTLDACLFAAKEPRPTLLKLALPGPALGLEDRIVLRIVERASGATLPPGEFNMPGLQQIVLQNLRLEGTVLVGELEGSGGGNSAERLVLLVDGLPVPETETEMPNVPSFRLPLPTYLLDGRGHVLQVRTQSGHLLGSMSDVVPAQLTPWESLQRYAGMPLPAAESPAAADRYRSLATSLQAATQNHEEDRAQQLSDAHVIVVEGFERRRTHHARLTFPTVERPDVSVVIPVHDKFDVTYHCLASLILASNRASFEVIVVDDASSDGTTRLRDIVSGIKVVRSNTGLGFVRSCNLGAEAVRGRYVVMLNNDTEPTASWLDELIFAFENFDGVGLAGSKLIYGDGRLQEAGGIVWGSGNPWNYGRGGNERDPRYNYTRQVDFVSGAAIMLPLELWRSLGGFAEDFAPAYFEDTDLAFRVRDAGRKVVFVPSSRVYHFEGMSNGTDVGAGIKRFQEVNRPKFKRRWHRLYRQNGEEGVDADLAKDRGVIGRILFVDAETPRIDTDAGSYAVLQEIRMVQGLGYKVTLLPSNMAYMGRHTEHLQRLGVEMVYAPFHNSMHDFLDKRLGEFDLVYITRYYVAAPLIEFIRRKNPKVKVALSLCDLHFLRATREALMRGEGTAAFEDIRRQRNDELALLRAADVGLSYSTTEIAVVESHNGPEGRMARLPWIIDVQKAVPPFSARLDIAFLGGYRHLPNIDAVEFFVAEVMPLLQKRLPDVRFLIYGSNMPTSFDLLASDTVILKGFVRDVAEVFDNCRVFVAPLRFGAGIKGKVMDSIAAGVPAVLSPAAVEGIPLADGTSASIARTPGEWASAIQLLYSEKARWNAMSKAAQAVGRTEFSFEKGRAEMGEVLQDLGLMVSDTNEALVSFRTRPKSPI